MLPGFVAPVGFVSQQKKLANFQLVDSKWSEGFSQGSLVLPNSIQAGDIILIHNIGEDTLSTGVADIPSNAVPSGFTQFDTQSTELEVGDNQYSAIRMTTSYRVATSNDAGRTITGMDGPYYFFLGSMIFRGDGQVEDLQHLNVKGTAGSDTSTRSVTNISTTGVVAPTLALAFYGANTGNLINTTKCTVSNLSGNTFFKLGSVDICMRYRFFYPGESLPSFSASMGSESHGDTFHVVALSAGYINIS